MGIRPRGWTGGSGGEDGELGVCEGVSYPLRLARSGVKA